MPQPGVVHEVDRGLLEQEEVRGPFDVDNGCDDDGGGREAARPLVARKAAENGCVQRISVLGPKLSLAMGCVKLSEKICVHLPSVGEQTAN